MRKLRVFFIGALVIFLIVLNNANAYATEFTKMDYKVLNSQEDIIEYIESDNIFLKEENTYGEKRYYKVTITEPGWLIICDYIDWSPNGYWVYKNKLMTSTIAALDKTSTLENLEGSVYHYRAFDKFYLNEGDYYIEAKNNANYFIEYVYFLPAKNIFSVNTIEYDEDYKSAHVTFNYIPSKRPGLYWAKTINKSIQDKWDDGGFIEPNDKYPEISQVWKILNDGITITENGDYSYRYISDPGYYVGYEAIVNFTIDKIGTIIEPKTVKLNKTKATIKVGNTLALKGTIKPVNATLTGLKWKSSNTKVATVDKNGKVTAKKKGTCVITVTTENGKKAKCKITVK